MRAICRRENNVYPISGELRSLCAKAQYKVLFIYEDFQLRATGHGRSPLPDLLWHVYILKCSDGTNYVGKTKNLDDRLNRHATKQISYTSTRLPIELITWITFTDEWKAVLMEKYLKSGSGRRASADTGQSSPKYPLLA